MDSSLKPGKTLQVERRQAAPSTPAGVVWNTILSKVEESSPALRACARAWRAAGLEPEWHADRLVVPAERPNEHDSLPSAEAIRVFAELVLGGPDRLVLEGVRDTRVPGITRFPMRLQNFHACASNAATVELLRGLADGTLCYEGVLVLLGGPATGKTHLLRGLSAEMAGRLGPPGVRFVRARELHELVGASGTGALERLWGPARAVVLDDLHELQDEAIPGLLRTADHLEDRGRLLVLSSREVPHRGQAMAAALNERLAEAPPLELHPPTPDVLVQIAIDRAAHAGVRMSEEGARALVEEVGSSVRPLIGAVRRAGIAELLRERALTPLPTTPPAELDLRPTVSAIIDMVGRFHDVQVSEILGPRRTRTVATARQIAMYLARRHTDLSLVELAAELHRDPSTILFGAKKITEQLEDPVLADRIRLIERELGL